MNIKTKKHNAYWDILKNIKKGDIIYYVSNTIFLGKAIVLEDGYECNFYKLYGKNAIKENSNHSDEGYAITCKPIINYTELQISIPHELTKKYNELNKEKIKPYEKWPNDIRAHTGGYCYELNDYLKKIIDKIVNDKLKELKNSNDLSDNITNSKFTYTPIDINKKSSNFGTSIISEKRNIKGKHAEDKVYEHLISLGFNVTYTGENSKSPADIKLIENNEICNLEIKNISNQTKKYIYMSDSELSLLYQKETQLCLYSNETIYITNPNFQKDYINTIINDINNIRKNTINNFNSSYYPSDIAILINKTIIDKYFIQINKINKTDLLKFLIFNKSK